MSMYCDAVTPDGRTVHFDDVISPGDVVSDRHERDWYVVGPDLGGEYPRLLPMDHDHYMAYWRASNPRTVEMLARSARSQ